MLKVRHNGKWLDVEKVFVKRDDEWVEVDGILLNKDGNWSKPLRPVDVKYETVEKYWDSCTKWVKKKFWRSVTKTLKTKNYVFRIGNGRFWVYGLKEQYRLNQQLTLDGYLATLLKNTHSRYRSRFNVGAKAKVIRFEDSLRSVTKTVTEAYYKWVNESYSCRKNRKVYKVRRIW